MLIDKPTLHFDQPTSAEPTIQEFHHFTFPIGAKSLSSLPAPKLREDGHIWSEKAHTWYFNAAVWAFFISL